MSKIEIYNADCLVKMKDIPDHTIDLILCDLPYGTTDCDWDCCIDEEKLWAEYKRILKDKGNILLFGDGGAFTSSLINSNKSWFKYNWFWIKNLPTQFCNAKKQPLRQVETISVFGNKGQNNYFPIMTKGKLHTRNGQKQDNTAVYVITTNPEFKKSPPTDEYYPKNVIQGKEYCISNRGRLHPSQKPVKLLEYLIKTYTTEDMIVLDNCMGSGSTGEACINTGRDFIGIELDENYFNIAQERLNNILEAKNGTK